MGEVGSLGDQDDVVDGEAVDWPHSSQNGAMRRSRFDSRFH